MSGVSSTHDAGDADEAARAALEATVSLSLKVLQVAMAVLAALFLGSGLFTVEPHEVALVRRLGRVLGTAETRVLKPGPHWAWPVLDEVVRVPLLRGERLATDAFALAATNEELVTGKPPERTGGLDPERDGYVLTGDANVLHAGLAARWVVDDPYAFASRTTDAASAAALARPLLERAASRAAASLPIDELLTTKKEAFLDKVKADLQASLDRLGVGIKVQGVELARDVTPSPQVRESFASVQKALQDRDRLVSEARSTAEDTKGRAQSDADRIRKLAESEAKRVRGNLDADVAVFRAYLPQWRRDRAGLESRLLAEVLAVARPEEVFLVKPGEPIRIRLERDQKAQREELLRRARAGEK